MVLAEGAGTGTPWGTDRQTRVRDQGSEAVLSRHHAVEPVDPARRPGGHLPVQYPGAAVVHRRAGASVRRDARLIPELGACRVRAGLYRGAVHLPGGFSRGPADVAPPVESTGPPGAAMVKVLGGDHSAPGPRAGDHHLH